MFLIQPLPPLFAIDARFPSENFSVSASMPPETRPRPKLSPAGTPLAFSSYIFPAAAWPAATMPPATGPPAAVAAITGTIWPTPKAVSAALRGRPVMPSSVFSAASAASACMTCPGSVMSTLSFAEIASILSWSSWMRAIFSCRMETGSPRTLSPLLASASSRVSFLSSSLPKLVFSFAIIWSSVSPKPSAPPMRFFPTLSTPLPSRPGKSPANFSTPPESSPAMPAPLARFDIFFCSAVMAAGFGSGSAAIS